MPLGVAIFMRSFIFGEKVPEMWRKNTGFGLEVLTGRDWTGFNIGHFFLKIKWCTLQVVEMPLSDGIFFQSRI